MNSNLFDTVADVGSDEEDEEFDEEDGVSRPRKTNGQPRIDDSSEEEEEDDEEQLQQVRGIARQPCVLILHFAPS
jgi:transcription elongation factor SPT6